MNMMEIMEGYIGRRFSGDESQITRIPLNNGKETGIILSTPPQVIHELRKYLSTIGDITYNVLVVDAVGTIVRVVKMNISEIGVKFDAEPEDTVQSEKISNL
jgi:hypothetical protein